MRLIGYINAFKENSFTIPIYSNGINFFNHYLDEFYIIVDFIKVEIEDDLLNKIYLSTDFKNGSIGACIFAGKENYLFFNQADKIIKEIIAYLDETTSSIEFTNIKREVLMLQELLIKNDSKFKNPEVVEESIVFNLDTNILKPAELTEEGIIKYSLEEYIELENDILNVKQKDDVEEKMIKKYIERVLLDKSLSHINKEVIFNLFQNFLNKNENAFEEILLNTDVGRDFSFYLYRFEDISPVEMTIEETLKFRADERRRKLKDFNYRFVNPNWERIREMENIPAYKRLGVDLTEIPSSEASFPKFTFWIDTQKNVEKDSTKNSEETKTTTNSG